MYAHMCMLVYSCVWARALMPMHICIYLHNTLHSICSYSSICVDTVCVQLIDETLTVRTYFIIYLLLPALALKRATCEDTYVSHSNEPL